MAEPVSISLDTFGTGKVDEHKIIDAIRDNISLSPGAIIRQLKLRRPIYQATAAYGHFGRENEGFPWEERNLVKVFKAVK